MDFPIQTWGNYTHDRTKLQIKSEQANTNDHVLEFYRDIECHDVTASVMSLSAVKR